MPQLKAVYDSKDAVPEAQRDLYVEHEGKFVLDAEGVQDVGGLKSALDRLKAERCIGSSNGIFAPPPSHTPPPPRSRR